MKYIDDTMADNICKNMYNSIKHSLLSTFYVIEIGLYLSATVTAFFIVEEMNFNVYLSKTKIDCGVDGDNDDSTCQASLQLDSEFKVRFDYFVMVILGMNVLSSIGLLLIEQRRVRNKETNNELVVRQLNDWLEIPGTISVFILISIMAGITEIYQLCFVSAFLLFNALLETIFVSYSLTSKGQDSTPKSKNILIKYISTFIYIVILMIITTSFLYLLANSNDFTILWGLPVFISWVVIFLSEYSKYYFYTVALKRVYKFIRKTVTQTQTLSDIDTTDTELTKKSPAELLIFFSKQTDLARRKVNTTIFVHQLLQRVIILFWKLSVFFLVWYGTNNYKINFI